MSNAGYEEDRARTGLTAELYKSYIRTDLRLKPSELIQAEGGASAFRLVFLESGSGTLRINDQTRSVVTPCILCLSEEDSLTSIAQLMADHLSVLYFRPELIHSTFSFDSLRTRLPELEETQGLDIYWLYPFLRSRGPLLIGPATAGRIAALLDEIDRELREQKGNLWPCRSRAELYELLNLVSRIDSESDQATSAGDTPDPTELLAAKEMDPDVEMILSYLNARYQQRITIPELTRHFAIDRTTLSKKFREATGRSVLNYVAHIRVRMACLLLRDTNLPIADVLERVGFEDGTHFGRTFRKHTGQAPSAYRQQHR